MKGVCWFVVAAALGVAVRVQADVWYVNGGSTGSTRDGRSWATAFRDIQSAVDAAHGKGGGEVWVCKGDYAAPGAGAVVYMEEAVDIFGGFLGTETERSQRDWRGSVTRLLGSGDRCAYGADNATIDGFTVTGGDSDIGGGMYNGHVSPLVRNCLFVENRALDGAAVYNKSSRATFQNCAFKSNTATGGALANLDASVQLYDCLFEDNLCAVGGAVYSFRSTAEFYACTFRNNQAGYGGAIDCYENGFAKLVNCVFWGNAAEWGGVIYGSGSATNCTFVRNRATEEGPVAYPGLGVVNSIVWGNRPDAGNVSGAYSDIQDAGTGNGCISADPGFVDMEAGDLRLLWDSPCVDAASPPQAPTADVVATSRPQGVGPDMGAYEVTAAQDVDGDGIPDAIEGAADLDGDVTPNFRDLDSDGDTILDAIEGVEDLDGDNIPSFADDDSDGDTIADRDETASDRDNDGSPNYLDTDSDGDGLSDSYEGTENLDADEWPNYLDTDSDGDSFPDDLERLEGTDPYDPTDPAKYGDVNRDQRVNAIDVQIVINAALGIDAGLYNPNVNGDTAVNAIDVQIVINIVLGVM